MTRIPKIGLMADRSRPLCAALLRGLVQYADLHGPWQFTSANDAGPAALKRLAKESTVLFVQVDDASTANALAQTPIPALAFRTSTDPLAFSAGDARGEVAADFRGAGRMAAVHLLGRRLAHLAFVGAGDERHGQSAAAERGFFEAAAEAAASIDAFQPRTNGRRGEVESDAEQLAQWLAALPRPAGVFAWNDRRGRDVLEACRLAGLHVPFDVAVIAVEEDDLLCELSDPPLSGVTLAGEAAGMQAAEALHRLIRGQRVETSVTIPAVGVVQRSSTQTVDVADREVAAALALIHRHATQPIGVEDIVGGLPISRRALELRFRKAVGRGPHAELQRARLMRAQQLLVQTDLPIPQVASAAGYSSGSYLAQVFQRRVAMSPAQYRRAHRAKDSAACG